MLPGRSSDSGPDSRKYCPNCGSSQWAILSDCHRCGKAVCDRCAARPFEDDTLRCVSCVNHMRRNEVFTGEVDDDLECGCYCVGDQADASDCDLHGLHRITTRVAVAQVPEWENQDAPF